MRVSLLQRIDEILECEKTVIFVEMPTLRPDGTFKLADYNEKSKLNQLLICKFALLGKKDDEE